MSIEADRRNSGVIVKFNERSQELDTVVRRMSSGIIVESNQVSIFADELVNFHVVNSQVLASHFKTSLVEGLKHAVVAPLLEKNGPNVLPTAKELPLFVRFLLCFVSGFSPLIWIAFVFVFLSYKPFGTPPSNIYNLALAIALLIVIFLNGLFAFFQEVRTSLALEGFKSLIPPNCLVIREGKTISVPPSSIVVGDIVVLESGNRVPADSRIIQASNLKLDKSMLTGETEPVRVTADSSDATISFLQAKNMAFMGSSVVEGSGLGLVVASGSKNQLAKIMSSVDDVQGRTTSLQMELNRFVVIIGCLALITAVVVIIEWAEYLNVKHKGFMTTSSMIANAISVLVAFVPEGLPLALSTGLTIIANRLCVTHKVLVKQLSIIETAGSMTLVASDKTGTLTQNKMMVSQIITTETSADSIDVSSFAQPFLTFIYRAAVLCNQSKLETVDGKRSAIGSNGIDKALLNWAEDNHVVDEIEGKYANVLSIPFSSATKIASTIVSFVNDSKDKLALDGDSFFAVIIKGAPEYILDRCKFYFDEKLTSKKDLTPAIVDKLLSSIAVEASKGKRVIALAQILLPKETFGPKFVFEEDESRRNFPMVGLTFLACIAVSDPPRPGVFEAVTTLRGAGIRVAMVTGDAMNTAVAIARQVGIITSASEDKNPSDDVHFHEKLDSLSKFMEQGKSAQVSKDIDVEKGNYKSIRSADNVVISDLKTTKACIIDGKDIEAVTTVGWDFIFAHEELVFARTTPEQKLLIVKESQSRGFRVGVTGDGVNDSPALKRADIGFAMGSGSDVAKDAASVVLLDDNFASIISAVQEGRLIFANLRKVIGYQIAAGCWSELIPVLATFFLGMPQPLSSFLMIIISCVTDVMAGIALMNEPPEAEIMKDPPRDLKTSRLVNWQLICYAYLFYGTMQSVGSFINYFLYMSERGPTHEISGPVPYDDQGQYDFPVGYRPSQLINAWNWGGNTGDLGSDETAAANQASSVFFVTLIVTQWGHLLAIRRKTPYFSAAYLNVEGSKDSFFVRLWKEIISSRPIPRILMAWAGAALVANLFNETPTIQVACGTSSVPGRYWGIAIGWSILCFSVNEVRKWIVLIFPDSWVAKVSYEKSL